MGTVAPQSRSESVRTELEKLLSSPGFATSGRLARFLRYVVEETLDGRGDALKETNVGLDVFDRKPGYDPRIDGIVRTEAIKLRARLKDYYEGEGAGDFVRIDLPKGGYVPSFSEVERCRVPKRVVPARKLIPVFLAIVGIVIAIVGWRLLKRPSELRTTPPPSIAVLPFIDMSAEGNQEYLCDGVTEQIIDALSRIPRFQVVARSSVFALKGKQQDVRDIGQRLNVRSVLEGSVQRSGSRVRVTAQLIDASNGFHLWSESYDREIKDIFTLEDDISRSIADKLQLKLAGPLKPTPQADVEAFNLYLQGRYWHYKWTPNEVLHSITFFEQAIAKDPNYALAYAGLADSYNWLGFFRVRPSEVMPKAKEAAEKAIELDPNLDSAHVALADVKALYDFDWDGSRQEFDRAFQINPSCSTATFSHALVYLAALGRTKEGIEEMKRAHDFDPLDPVTNTYLGVLYFFDRQYDAAIAQLQATQRLAPDFREANAMLYYTYVAAGRPREARAQLQILEAANGKSPNNLEEVQVLALEGKKEEALKALAAWTPRRDAYVSQVKVAFTYFALGDLSKGLDKLDRAYQEHDGMLAFAKTWPGLDPARSEPRFKALLGKLNLAP